MPRLIPANTITAPQGFDPLNPGSIFAALPKNGTDSANATLTNQHVIGPLLVRERWQCRTRTRLRVVTLDIALDMGTDQVELQSRSNATAEDVLIAPTAAIQVAALPPAISIGAAVAPPAAAITVAAVAPVVASGASVAVPAAVISMAGVAPEAAGRPRVSINVPTAPITLAAAAPAVATGVSVAVPTAGVAVAGVMPTQTGADPGIDVGAITYSQHSAWSGTTLANNSIMTDDSFANTGAATSFSGTLAWVQMDLGAVYSIATVVVGTATAAIPGGWNKSYTENANIDYSDDGVNWTYAFNVGSFASDGIYTFNVSFSARYIRASKSETYFAISEFYALSPGQTWP